MRGWAAGGEARQNPTGTSQPRGGQGGCPEGPGEPQVLMAGGKADRVLLNLQGCLGAWDGCSPRRAWQGGVSALGCCMDPVGRLYLCQRGLGAPADTWLPAVLSGLSHQAGTTAGPSGTAGRQARKDSHLMRERAPADGGSFLPPGWEAKRLSDQRWSRAWAEPTRGRPAEAGSGAPRAQAHHGHLVAAEGLFPDASEPGGGGRGSLLEGEVSPRSSSSSCQGSPKSSKRP